MKIISKFRDYYDGMARFGVDENLLLIRTTEITNEEVRIPDTRVVPWHSGWQAGFARIGSIFVPFMYKVNNTDYKLPPSIILFKKEDYALAVEAEQRYWRGKGTSWYNTTSYPLIPQTADIEIVYNLRSGSDNRLLFSRIAYPRLLDYSLNEVLNPYDVHQELVKVLANKADIDQPDNTPDIYKLRKHGFDDKISFRTRKG